MTEPFVEGCMNVTLHTDDTQAMPTYKSLEKPRLGNLSSCSQLWFGWGPGTENWSRQPLPMSPVWSERRPGRRSQSRSTTSCSRQRQARPGWPPLRPPPALPPQLHQPASQLPLRLPGSTGCPFLHPHSTLSTCVIAPDSPPLRSVSSGRQVGWGSVRPLSKALPGRV